MLDLLQKMPEELVEMITSKKDVVVLKRYLSLASKADSVEEFLHRMD